MNAIKVSTAARRKFAQHCAAIGKPITNPEIVNVYVSALRAGLDNWQATQIALMARDAGNVTADRISADGLNDATHARHARENPRGMWAAVIAKRPHDWRWLKDHDARTIWNEHVEDYHACVALTRAAAETFSRIGL